VQLVRHYLGSPRPPYPSQVIHSVTPANSSIPRILLDNFDSSSPPAMLYFYPSLPSKGIAMRVPRVPFSLTLLSAGILLIGADVNWVAAQERSPQQNQIQTQEQIQEQEQIYGSQLMTPEERTEFRTRMRAATTNEEREQIRREHHEQMQVRAKQQGVTLPDEPPVHGGRGMGPGGGGMGPGSPGGTMGPGGGGGTMGPGGGGGMGPGSGGSGGGRR
jgi:hypothetical protein